MSNQSPTTVMGQIVGAFEKLVSNPNSKIDFTNFENVFDRLSTKIMEGYQKVADMNLGTVEIRETASAPASAPTPVAPATATAIIPVADNASAPMPVAANTSKKSAATPKVSETTAETQPAEPVKTASAAKKISTLKVSKPAPTSSPAKAAKDATPTGPLTDEQEAAKLVAEHGSAREAAAALNAAHHRGRKSAVHKLVESMAKEEIRMAPEMAAKTRSRVAIMANKGQSAAEVTGYKFADIGRKPIMDPEEAIGYEKITCLIDGEARTMLSRWIKSKYQMTPEEYIAHFNLREDYPMTSQAYVDEKQKLAKKQGLGLGNRKHPKEDEAPAQAAQATVATAAPAESNRKKRGSSKSAGNKRAA